jgi:response regulator of the lytR/algR family
MNYLICDDEPAAAESLKAKIAELEPDSSVRIFTTLQALLFNIEDFADRIDGVFMDIKLRNANGISGAARLLASHPEIKLVYITGYASEYIQELYCVDSKALPAAILTKPIEMKYLRNALSKIHEREKQAELLPIKNGGTVTYLSTAEIISIVSDKRKLIIRHQGGCVEIYGRLSDYREKLPASFAQCHKSCIVNLNRINRIVN